MKKYCSHWQRREGWFLMCWEFRTGKARPESVTEAALNQGCQRGMELAPEKKGFTGLWDNDWERDEMSCSCTDQHTDKGPNGLSLWCFYSEILHVWVLGVFCIALSLVQHMCAIFIYKSICVWDTLQNWTHSTRKIPNWNRAFWSN